MIGLPDLSHWAEQHLGFSGSAGAAYPALALGGLLASPLPCVYPLYPITAALVQNRGSEGPRWRHPAVYYGGLASVYGLLGMAAGVFGGAFNAALRLAATNLIIGVILVLLAVATAGLLHLPMFGPRDTKVPGGLPGTWLMGMTAGLLSSACVGPVVVGVLIGVATGTNTVNVAAVLLAGAKMLVFGLGLGLPFLAVGLAGVRLPRSGPWLLWVQRLLGVALLVFAHDYFVKALETWGFESSSAEAIIWAAAIFAVSVVLIQSKEQRPIDERVLRAIYSLALLISASVLFRTLSGPAVGVHGAEVVAVASLATLLGGVTLARAVNDPDLAKSIASSVERSLLPHRRK